MSVGLALASYFGWGNEAAHVAVGAATGAALAATTGLRLIRQHPSAPTPPAVDA